MKEFTDEEQMLLKKELHFLNEKGYQMINHRDSLNYEKNDILIDIYNQHLSDSPGVLIRYKAYNEIFHLDVFLYYFNDLKPYHLQGMADILVSINLLKEHYDEFMDIQWCRNISKIVDGKLAERFPDVVKPEDFFKTF